MKALYDIFRLRPSDWPLDVMDLHFPFTLRVVDSFHSFDDVKNGEMNALVEWRMLDVE